ncbi:von Willebrand factor A domain-containing protein 2-like [Mytilus trossulus]|uniref:von Willebrand factor A domain-containing protein 2-like n=1 Tax=Mytilus trossulus TaxID=6551 RepID=UPI0030076079
MFRKIQLQVLVIFIFGIHLSIQQLITGCDTRPADVIFLLDSSGSVGGNFNTEKQFIVNFTQAVHIGPNKVQVGVVRYAFNAATEISLNDYSSEGPLRQAINNIQYVPGGTNTDSALRHIFYNGFTFQEGDRSSVPNFLVVITDGFSYNADATIKEANRLHQYMTVYAIGVGNSIDINELAHIATDRNHVFIVPDYHALHTLQTELHPIACNGMQTTTPPTVQTDSCSSSPCVHGRCFHDPLSYVCLCQTGYNGKNCDKDVCSSAPCQNGGKCYKNVADYVCVCNNGYFGKNCQTGKIILLLKHQIAAVQLHVRMVGLVLRMPLTMCVSAVMVTVAKTVKLPRQPNLGFVPVILVKIMEDVLRTIKDFSAIVPQAITDRLAVDKPSQLPGFLSLL